MSAQQFEQIIKPAERAEIFESLTQASHYFLDHGQPIYLEGFGVLIPNRVSSQNSYHHQDKLVLREETRYKLRFEKCDDLAAHPQTLQGRVIETRELARKAFIFLPIELQLQWSEAQFRAILLGAIQHLKQEVIIQGYSPLLHSVGEFYALHNRQGSSLADWYAGADVFLATEKQSLIKVGNSRAYEIPILNSAAETFEALNGPALARFDLNAAEQLMQIGYEVGNEPAVKNKAVSISVFHRKSEDPAQVSLLYCSDGFRELAAAKSTSEELPYELVLQVEYPKQFATSAKLESVPSWPLRLFAAAWLLAHSSKSKILKPGLGLSFGVSFVPELDSDLQSVLLCNCSLVKLPQRCGNGHFRYLSLTAITADEARVAELYSPQFLLRMLEQRNLDQVVKPKRSSLISKTGLLDSLAAKAIACKESPLESAVESKTGNKYESHFL